MEWRGGSTSKEMEKDRVRQRGAPRQALSSFLQEIGKSRDRQDRMLCCLCPHVYFHLRVFPGVDHANTGLSLTPSSPVNIVSSSAKQRDWFGSA